MKKVVIFGITGSVGNQTIDVINHIKSEVFAKFGIKLEVEQRII